MKLISKRALSAILAIVMVILMVPYASAQTSDYEKNTEARHIICTSLSDQAVDYYTSEVKDKYNGIGDVVAGNTTVYARFSNLAKVETNSSESSYTAYKGDSATYYQKEGDNYVKDENDNKVEVCTNSLFYALHNIMQDTYTTKTSYPGYGKTSLAHHWLSTDTTNSSDKEFYRFFYADTEANSSAVMQREHIWPKSRASYHMATGGGGADLHHLRPAVDKVNLKKLNWSFGECPNKSAVPSYNVVKVDSNNDGVLDKPVLWKFVNKAGETCIDVLPEVRGDVARILLYVYVMWSQPNLFTDITYTSADEAENENNVAGESIDDMLPDLEPDPTNKNHDTGLKAIESLDTLLNWIKNDPVDTWEMKRNDITESIQGNRNVFIDYPELAWLLFDKAVPNDIATPSGMAKSTQGDKAIEGEQSVNDPVTVCFGDNLNGTSGNNGVSRFTAYYETGLKNGVRENLKTTSTTEYVVDKSDYTNIKKVYIASGQQVERDTLIYYKMIPQDTEIKSIGCSGINGSTAYATSISGYKGSDMYYTKINYTTTTVDGETIYTFQKPANGKKLDDTANKSGFEDKESITMVGISQVCELLFKSSSSSGTHSGAFFASYVDSTTGKTIPVDTGDIVPNGTTINMLLIPDATSTFKNVTSDSFTENGDGTYSATYTADCSSGSNRLKEITITWGTDPQLYYGIFGNGLYRAYLKHEAGDEFYQYAQFIRNFEITGVQIKPKYTETRDLRYVAVVNSKLLGDAEEYGFLVATTTQKEADECMEKGYLLTCEAAEKPDSPITKVVCTNTENNISGDYGKVATLVPDERTGHEGQYVYDTSYKYVTMAIEDIPASETDTIIIVRPYVKLSKELYKIYDQYGKPVEDEGKYTYTRTIYGDYLRSIDESFTACAASYNQIIGLAE